MSSSSGSSKLVQNTSQQRKLTIYDKNLQIPRSAESTCLLLLKFYGSATSEADEFKTTTECSEMKSLSFAFSHLKNLWTSWRKDKDNKKGFLVTR